MIRFFSPLILSFCLSASFGLPNFPGAQGWGTETVGGRNGRVILVTNTNPSGAGSLLAAFQAAGPRIVVFRTSGVINMNFDNFNASTSFLTVAGQTSPGGITLTANGGTILESYHSGFHDAVFRFLRVRSNDNTYDNISFATVYNIVIDHCDFSGASDECFDICSSHDFTVQWTTIANSSSCSGCQTYGALIAYAPTSQITMHHSLWAHHINRSPYFHWNNAAAINNGQIDFRNNISYDGRDYFLVLGMPGGPIHINIVSNYFKAGPSTPVDKKPLSIPSEMVMYDSDNVWDPQSGQITNDIVNMWSNPQTTSTPWPMPEVTTMTADQTYDTVLAKVGAWPRDAMNTRTVNEVINRTGTMGKDDDAKITSGPTAPADADNDGMPDFWETGMGFNPNDSAGKNADHDNDGYTNIEEYINDLALARLCEDYYNPVYPVPDNWDDYDPSCCKSLAVEIPRTMATILPDRLTVSPNPGYGAAFHVKTSLNHGKIRIFDMAGRLVVSFPAGKTARWNPGHNIAAGVYTVSWTHGPNLKTQKHLVLIK
jgi:pectate lyase